MIRNYGYLGRTAVYPREIYDCLYRYGINGEPGNAITPIMCMLYPKAEFFVSDTDDLCKYIGAIPASQAATSGITGFFSRKGMAQTSQKMVDELTKLSKIMPVVIFAAPDRDIKLDNPNEIKFTVPKEHVIYENIYSGPFPRPFRYGALTISVYTPPGSTFPGKELIKDLHEIFIKKSDQYENSNKSDIAKFNRELTRYKYVLDMQNIIKFANPRDQYEWLNTLERYLITLANVAADSIPRIEIPRDYVFIDLPETHPLYVLMESEIAMKKLSDNPKAIINKCRSLVNEFLNLDSRDYLIAKYTRDRQKVIITSKPRESTGENRPISDPGIEVTYTTDHVRYNGLIHSYYAFGGVPGSYTSDPDLLIAIMIVRYKCIMDRGQQWNIPYNWYKHLYDTFELNLEGFGSPLNSQMLMIKGENPQNLELFSDLAFCSLFRDTDELFGSHGNVFKLDIVKHVKSRGLDHLTAAVNPPYVESLMADTCDTIISWIEQLTKIKFPALIFTGFPAWTDAEFYKKFDKNPWIREKRLLKQGEFYYQNASASGGIGRIYTKSGYAAYILDNYAEVGYIAKNTDYPKAMSMLNLVKWGGDDWISTPGDMH